MNAPLSYDFSDSSYGKAKAGEELWRIRSCEGDWCDACEGEPTVPFRTHKPKPSNFWRWLASLWRQFQL